MVRKNASEKVLMEDSVLRPPQIKAHKDLTKGLQDWDIQKQAWYAVGGRVISPEEESGILMRMLPADIRQRATFEFRNGLHADPDKIREWAKNTVRLLQVWNAGSFNIMVNQDEEEDAELLQVQEQEEGQVTRTSHSVDEPDDKWQPQKVQS